MENTTDTGTYYDKADGIARWVGASLTGAFFASLERCACVNVQTEEGEDEEAHDRPLMLTGLGSVNFSSFNSNSVNTAGNDPPPVENLPV